MTDRTPNLRGLIALARREGVDIRPTLLRVITDLFVQEPVHSAAEVDRYVELARHMLQSVDEPSRVAVSMKLARYRGAPRVILRMLATDTPAVASHVLRRASFDAADFAWLADRLEGEHRAVLAERGDLPAVIAARLGVPASRIPETRHAAVPTLAPCLAEPVPTAVAVAEPPPAEETRAEETPVEAPQVEAPRAALPLPNADELAFVAGELERAALQRRVDDFIDILARAFGLGRARAEEIVRDPSGERVALVCRALDMGAETFARIMLFLDPTIGRSVALVFSLAENYGRLTVAEAREVVASWRETRRPAGRHVPVSAPDGVGRHAPEGAGRYVPEPRRAPAPAPARVAARG